MMQKDIARVKSSSERMASKPPMFTTPSFLAEMVMMSAYW